MSIQRFPEFERFADELARLRGRMQTLYAEVRSKTGLAEMDLTVLTAAVNAVTPPTVAQIGRSLGHPRQVVQRAAHRLAELGLIELTDNPDHKRASLLIPTDAGQELKASFHASSSAVTAALLARIDPARFEVAAKQLAAIRTDLEAHMREKQS